MIVYRSLNRKVDVAMHTSSPRSMAIHPRLFLVSQVVNLTISVSAVSFSVIYSFVPDKIIRDTTTAPPFPITPRPAKGQRIQKFVN